MDGSGRSLRHHLSGGQSLRRENLRGSLTQTDPLGEFEPGEVRVGKSGV
jgi:hypothetical protein